MNTVRSQVIPAKYFERFYSYLPYIIILWSIWFALQNQFLQDDAFISFRYAENLNKGYGLVFNPGERVEGYTNFLWTLLISFGMKIGFQPETFSVGLGCLLYLGSMTAYFLIAKRTWNDYFVISSFLLLLGSNYSFSSYATGGLETSLVTFLTAYSFYITQNVIEFKKYEWKLFFLLGLLFSLLFLTRMDSGLFIGITGLFLLVHLVRNKIKNAILLTASTSVPFLLIILIWLSWKYSFYGTIFPNTLAVKTEGSVYLNILSGLEYLYSFITTYWIGSLFILSLLYILNKNDHSLIGIFVLSAAIILIQACYLLLIGGDFMEFRLIVPVFPLIVLIVFFTIFEKFRRTGVIAVLISITFASYYYRAKDKVIISLGYSGIDSIQSLKRHLKAPVGKWNIVGRKLHDYFGGTDIRIGVAPAGAIPYYSKLYAVDMLGLSDKNIKDQNRFRKIGSLKSGHKRCSTVEYLIERNVNLIIGHPTYKFANTATNGDKIASFAQSRQVSEGNGNDPLINLLFPEPLLEPEKQILNKPTFIWIPIDESTKLLVLYLKRSDTIDKLIAEQNWEVIRN